MKIADLKETKYHVGRRVTVSGCAAQSLNVESSKLYRQEYHGGCSGGGTRRRSNFYIHKAEAGYQGEP